MKIEIQHGHREVRQAPTRPRPVRHGVPVTHPNRAAIPLAALLALSAAPAAAQNTDWDTYLGDAGRRHYSPLAGITRENVADLEVAWTYDSGELRPGNSTMYTSPLVVDGVLYGLSPRLVAFALDAATGEELWRYDPGLGGAPQRGLTWWERGAAARLFFTGNDSLVALDPAAGRPVVDFGDDGVVDLSATFAEDGPLRVTVPGVVFEDLIVLGFSTSEAADALPGAISAYSALDGSLVWRHRNVPRPGEPGAETWAEGALEAAGGANTWTGMALDAGRGLLFAPTGSATPDFYGASRVGDNLFANSLLAIDARTGERRWHFQTIRHDVWDRDLPSPPTLVRLERGGRTIDAVAVTTKSGHLFLFERETGEPLYDVGEVAAHPSAIPGEVVVTTQPESSIALTRQRFEMTTRSQESIDFVSAIYERLDQRPWAPPSLQGTMMYPGYDGGQEWGGSAFDPATNRLIVNSSEIGAILQLYEVPAGFSARAVYAEHCGTCHGADRAGNAVGPALTGVGERLTAREIDDVVRNGRGRMTGFAHLDEIEIRAAVRYVRNPEEEEDRPPSTAVDYAFGGYRWLRDQDGLPGNRAPWGTLTSVDLATGGFDWQVPFGDYPQTAGQGLGSESYGGPVVTASGLIFIAATPDRKIRAYDTRDGAELWQADLPAAGFSTPAVYAVDGRQYVVIAAGGGRMGPPSGSEYVAFALPEPEDRRGR